jgi:large subunit ribosomal protein L6
LSRIGRKPIPIPKGVEVSIEESRVSVKGPKGALAVDYLPAVRFEREGDSLRVINVDESKINRKFHGLYRSLVANSIKGVHEGFTRRLEVFGQGYRAVVDGRMLELFIGYSHPIIFGIPEGMEVKVEEKRGDKLIIIDIWGIDKQAVGQFAANIRAKRPPEPYKGKGIRYTGEYVRQKQGKKTV